MTTHPKISFSAWKQTVLLLPLTLGLVGASGYAYQTVSTDLDVSLTSSWVDDVESTADCNRILVYQLKVTNKGPDRATAAEVRGHLVKPALSATWSCAIDGDSLDNSLCYDVAGTDDINTKVGLAPGRSAVFMIRIPIVHNMLCETFTYQGQVASSAAAQNTQEFPSIASISYQENDPNLKDNFTELTVGPSPDVTLTLQATPTVYQGSVPVTFTSFVRNEDRFCKASMISAQYLVPSGVQIEAVEAPAGWSYHQDGNKLVFEKDTLDPNAVFPIQFTLLPPASKSSLDVSATLTTNSQDVNLVNNQTNKSVQNLDASLPGLAGGGISCNLVPMDAAGLPSAWMGITIVTLSAWWRMSRKIA